MQMDKEDERERARVRVEEGKGEVHRDICHAYCFKPIESLVCGREGRKDIGPDQQNGLTPIFTHIHREGLMSLHSTTRTQRRREQKPVYDQRRETITRERGTDTQPYKK
mmetsp:Transcript_5644/g.11204  ORF Transcript_5644/g.11204 Transcript_5644/m.11204 type:complete len:109 (-) Transcript_5644:642-968(-)